MRAYLICCQVLQAARDPRAEAVLNQAQALLLERAIRISDESTRARFLNDVPWNRELQRLTNTPIAARRI